MQHKVLTIGWFTFLEASRTKVVWLMVAVVFASFFAGLFFSNTAITETRQIQVAVTNSAIRLGIVLLATLFVVATVSREREERGLEWLLSMPVCRIDYYLGKLAGFSAAALVATLMSCVPLAPYVPIHNLLYWAFSFYCELLIVVSFALFCALGVRYVAYSVFITMAFYVLSRSMAAISLLAENPILPNRTWTGELTTTVVEAISHILPSLNRFSETAWLIYDTPARDALVAVVVQTFVYLLLLAGASLFDLYRKEF